MQEALAKCRNTLIRTTIKGIFDKSLERPRIERISALRFLAFGFLVTLVGKTARVECLGGWTGHGLQPKVTIDYVHGPLADTIKRFKGNNSQIDNFKIVVEDGTALFVGGTNTVYILNSKDLTEHRKLRIDWPPEPRDYELCTIKGKSKSQCQNFIRVIAKTDEQRILICGTHAFKPRCRHYKYKDGSYSMDQEFDGKGLTPYDPAHNSTYLLADGELYTATVSDFSGSDPLIYKEPLRTEQYDSKILNTPDFVKMLEDDDYVYFFLREQAVEYINCGKSVYSRVARVCKNDKGGPNKFRNRWTTYLKSRLNCSIPGDYPFYFNHLQSVSSIVEGSYMGEKTKIIYGVFTTPENAIGGNAICAFQIRDVLDTFEGPFKEQETANSNWLPVRDMKVPDPRPGRCSQESQKLPESSLRFIQDHSIMDEAVPAYFGGSPLFIRANIEYPSQFREIAIDPQIKTSDGQIYDIMFVGTDKGQVLKIVNSANKILGEKNQQPVLVEELQILKFGEPILGLQMSEGSDKSDKTIHVIARDEILAIPLQRCHVANTCSACVQLQDPYCGWDVVSSKCVSHNKFNSMYASEFLQNVTVGRHRQCGDSESPVLIEEFKDISSGNEKILPGGSLPPHRQSGEIMQGYDPSIRIEQHHGRYSTEELSMAVATSCVSALIVGFVAGFLLARKCQCGSDNPYHVPYLNRSGYEEENIYAKVDDMTYYPVVGPHQGALSPGDHTLTKHHNIINNMVVTLPPGEQIESKTLNLHQANLQKQKDFNTFNAFSTVHRSQKIYL